MISELNIYEALNSVFSDVNKAGSTVTSCQQCSINTKTVATVPKNRKRTTIGVGEEVTLTFSAGSANWTITGGKLSATIGTKVTFTAPDRAVSITITATGSACSASITFTIIEPSGVSMKRVSGTNVLHTQGTPSVGIKTDIYILPSTVSFENIDISEDDAIGIVTGYFIGTSLDGIHHAGHGAGTWVPVGTVTAGNGSKVDGHDDAHVILNASFGTPYSAGTFDWAIPWKFRVGSGTAKKFTTVHQRFTIDSNGAMTVSKAGASGSANLNDQNSVY